MTKKGNRTRIGVFVLSTALMLLPRWAEAFEPYLNALVLGTTHPVISGQTNLPDGAEMTVMISRRESPFFASAKAIVSAGSFKTEPFSDEGKELSPGSYSVMIRMNMAGGQPPSVASVTGKYGEKLTGIFVKVGPFGVYVEEDLSFTVGGK
jgi:hypothetical protein